MSHFTWLHVYLFFIGTIKSFSDKCQLPYSGGCSLEHRVCFTDELNTVECGECILGYNADIPGGECSLSKSVHHINILL